MSSNLIKQMLGHWEQRSAEVRELVNTEIRLNRDDLVRIEALAEVYGLPAQELLANLIGTALREVEEQMPYVAGEKVIRVEEGDPVYEDVGRTPAYLAAVARHEKDAG